MYKTKTSTSIIPREEYFLPMSNVIDNFFNTVFSDPIFEDVKKFHYPKMNVLDFNDRIEIEAEISGVKKEDINISYKNNLLTISGKASKINEDKNSEGKFLMRELKRSSFSRSVSIRTPIDEDNINADFENGVLKINIPKIDPVVEEPKRISIN